MLPNHPLDWPLDWPVTPQGAHQRGSFSARAGLPGDGDRAPGALTIAQATARVAGELRRIDSLTGSIVISSNARTRGDGLVGISPGAAARWQTAQGEPKVIAIDIYARASDNLAAIAAALCALRTLKQHCGALILQRAMGGFVPVESIAASRPPPLHEIVDQELQT
jgi:hypothetical protein